MVLAKLCTSLSPGITSKSHTSDQKVVYRWVEGTRVNNYATSAKSWLEFTQRPDFLEGLQTLVNDTSINNENRAAAVEDFIL
jgi:hypothetical protein